MRRKFARVSRPRPFTAICVFLLFGSPSKGQEEAFYKGKTLRVIAGTTAGAYDQWARVIAAHIVKYIPGNPQRLCKNFQIEIAHALARSGAVF